MNHIGWRLFSTSFRKNFWEQTYFTRTGNCMQRERVVKMHSDIQVRQPNVLMFLGEYDFKKSQNIQDNLQQCLDNDQYIVYNLTFDQVLKDPWQENSELLVISCDQIDKQIAKCFFDYLYNGGKILNFCSDFHIPQVRLRIQESIESLIKIKYKDVADTILCRGSCFYETAVNDVHNLCFDKNSQRPVISKLQYNKGTIILSELHLEMDPEILKVKEIDYLTLKQSNISRISILKNILSSELGLHCADPAVLQFTEGYIFSNSELLNKKIIQSVTSKTYNDKNMTLQLINKNKESVVKASKQFLPLYLPDTDTTVLFDETKYFSYLKTKTLGQSVIFIEVTTSTMAFSEVFPEFDEIVYITDHQIEGRGRVSNKWISIKGCAMFTLHFTVPLSSPLGHRLSIIQHIMSLAVVSAVRKQLGYEEVELNLKWPNDIYYNKQIKIGGVLVSSSIQGYVAHIHVGVGVNVSNKHPTICINDVIQLYNDTCQKSLPLLSTEELIARSITELENIMTEFNETGPKSFLERYYSYWMHKNQNVTVAAEERKGTVIGIDEYGFLLVQTEDGKKIVLQPDGNRFDIMKNLIITR